MHEWKQFNCVEVELNWNNSEISYSRNVFGGDILRIIQLLSWLSLFFFFIYLYSSFVARPISQRPSNVIGKQGNKPQLGWVHFHFNALFVGSIEVNKFAGSCTIDFLVCYLYIIWSKLVERHFYSPVMLMNILLFRSFLSSLKDDAGHSSWGKQSWYQFFYVPLHYMYFLCSK